MFLFSIALAAPGASTVARQALSVDPRADLVVACSSLGPVVRALRSLPLPPAMIDELGPEVRRAYTLLSPERSEGMGVDLEGSVVLLSGGDGTRMRLPFRGTPVQAEAYLQGIEPQTFREGAGWIVPGREQFLEVEQTATDLVFRQGAPAADELAAQRVAAALASLPDAPGCVAAGWDSSGPGEKPFGVGVFLPFKGSGPLVLRVETPESPAPEVLARGGWLPPLPSLPEAPMVVGGLSVPVDTILDYVQQRPELASPELAALREHIRFPAGVVLAGFRSGQENSFVAALPVALPSGAPFPARRLMAFLRRLDQEAVHVTGRTRFAIELDKKPLVGEVRNGLVLVSNSAPRLESLGDELEPWVSEEAQAWGRRWPVFLMTPTPKDFDARMGIRGDGPVWELALELKLLKPVPPEATAFVMGLLTSAALPNFLEMGRKTHRAAAVTLLEQVRTAELSWQAEHGAFLAAAAAPREVEALSTAAVPWRGEPAWSDLGIAPDDEQRCSYRVELAEADFVAWATCDLDGDGNHAMIRATMSTPAALVTGADVY